MFTSRFRHWHRVTIPLLLVVTILFLPLKIQPSYAISLPPSDVFAWGYNTSGQLGDNSTVNSESAIPVDNLTWGIAVAGGGLHSLALKSDGIVWSWGNNAQGQLGNGTTNDSRIPVQVNGLNQITSVKAGVLHSLALKSDRSVWAWGDNSQGQLGDGTNISKTTPVQVSGLSDVIAIASGGMHNLALKSDGTVWTWGYNLFGQLGNDTKTNSNTAVQVVNLQGVIAVSAGGFHSMALKSDGSVWTWGLNVYGQLGDSTSTDRSSPVQVSGLAGVVGIVGGGEHSLALKSNGTVWAWGNNGNGRLGDGTTVDQSSPVQVVNLNGITSIAAGGTHSLALKADGTVWAWGYNNYGQLGDGTTTDRSSPVQVTGLTGATAIAIGSNTFGYHNLALVPIVKVTTSNADNVTSNSSRLNGILNNLISGSSAALSFQWGTVSQTYTHQTPDQAGSILGDFHFDLNTLSPKTTYYFRARAVGDGVIYGAEHSFTTLPIAPTVVSNAASTVTANSAIMNGQLSNLGTAGRVYVSFQWGIDQSYDNVTTTQEMSGIGTFSTLLTNLAPKTTYHFRAVATGEGTVNGLDMTFTTSAIPPAVSSLTASPVGSDNATIKGNLSNLGSSSQVSISFQWGLTQAYDNVTAQQAMTAGGPFSNVLSALQPKTTYHYRAVAVGDGTVYGQDLTFTTLPVTPTVSTGTATGISYNLASLNGNLADRGTAGSVAVSFEWGLTNSYGYNTTPQNMMTAGHFGADLSNLSPDTTYYFRSKAVGDVTVYGRDQTFTTTVPPWDVNKDHITDVTDVILIGLHWNQTGTPGWIPEDVNKDGIVDVSDVTVVGLHWNQTW